MINSNIQNNVTQKLNIPDYSTNSKDNIEQETLDEEEESKQSLNPNSDHQNLLDMNDSGIIHVPNKHEEKSIISDNNTASISSSDYVTPLNDKLDTLDESISSTIFRDLKLIYYKLKYVMNPFSPSDQRKKHIRQWDLWGPLLFITFLSCTLSIRSSNKSHTIISIFAIFWIGNLLVYINGNLLNSNIKFFQTICLLGYCLFPLNISAFILAITNFYEIIRFIIVLLTCFWSLFSIEGYFRIVSSPHQKYLVFYPAILMFAFISWFIFVTE
jgi:hypothetical protein